MLNFEAGEEQPFPTNTSIHLAPVNDVKRVTRHGGVDPEYFVLHAQ